ncbi:MAG: FimB/Mfa2 family fimbrial subunit [Tannerella sp.]|jgi:hypothetical protein|nr:FimB/Mfa2 family fimbrial subunit [Tannerella sp.]
MNIKQIGMECVKKIGLLLCASALFAMQGCVRNSLEDCPPEIRYGLSFDYLLHTVDVNGNNIYSELADDRFYEDVDKMYLYVFDNTTGMCVFADTTLTGPFPDGYVYQGWQPGSGTYDIIVWGWGRNTGNLTLNRSTGTIPAAIIPGQTHISVARFILNELNNSVNDNVYGKIEKTFYGEIQNKYISPFFSDVDTVELINISKLVRVIIPDAEEAGIPDWENSIKITIEGDNGSYLFTPGVSSPLRDPDPDQNHVIDNPYQTLYTDSVLRADPIPRFPRNYRGITDIDSGLVVDISTLRLIASDPNMKLVITWPGLDKPLVIPLMKLLEDALAIGLFDDFSADNLQRLFDRIDQWEIMFNITDTYVSASIGIQCGCSILDWHVVVQRVSVGGILQ